MKTAQHPVLPFTISFDPCRHRYTDNEGSRYISGTAFVKQFFTPFDAPAAAARVGARTGRPAAELEAEWKAKGEATADYGTRLHAYAEARVLGVPESPAFDPADERARKVVDAALSALEKQYEFLGAEQIVFDPLYLVAGSIDLPMRNRETGAICVADWKTIRDVSDDNYGKFGLPPIEHIPDSKRVHCGLRLSLYGELMLGSGYLPDGTEVETAVIHVPQGCSEPTWIPLPFVRDEIQAMLTQYHETQDWVARVTGGGGKDTSLNRGAAALLDQRPNLEALPF